MGKRQKEASGGHAKKPRKEGDTSTASRREGKKRVKLINNKLAQLARDKEYGLAQQEFKRLKAQGLPATIHTYTNMINAAVRCGETQATVDLLNEARGLGLEANVVTYTAVIKGVAQAGRFEKALEVLEDARQHSITLNIRTFDTLLRGCVRWVDVNTAKSVWKQMRALEISPGPCSFEYYIHTLCLALRCKAAWKKVRVMQKHHFTGQSPVYSWLAMACALRGDVEGAKTAIALSSEAQALPARSISQHDTDGADASKSHALFNKLKSREVARTCALVEAAIAKPTPPVAITKVLDPTMAKPPPGLIFLPQPWSPAPSQDLPRATVALRKAFPRTTVQGRSVNLEVCMGGGEWLVDRATADPDSLWLGIEIRVERSVDGWAVASLAGIDNLSVICGDARAVVKTNLPHASINQAFINFPEPPVWMGSPNHLVDEDFLISLRPCLAAGAKVWMASDDLAYTRTVAATFKRLEMRGLYRRATREYQGFTNTKPEVYGAADSYFDKLWRNGNKSARYFVCFEAAGTPTSSA